MTTQVWLALAGIVTNIIIGAYVYGKLTQRVSGHDEYHAAHAQRFRQLDDEQGRQWDTLGRHGERISAVEARCRTFGHD